MTQAPTQPLAPTDALMPLLRFDADDLRHNRAGQLSARQQQRLRAQAQRALLSGAALFFALTIVASVLLFWGLQNDSFILNVLGGFVVMLNAILIGLFARHFLRLQADQRAGVVRVARGPLLRVIRPVGRVGNYSLRVGDSEFTVNKEVFKLFRHQHIYVLYSAPNTRQLLAAEWLDSGEETP